MLAGCPVPVQPADCLSSAVERPVVALLSVCLEIGYVVVCDMNEKGVKVGWVVCAGGEVKGGWGLDLLWKVW